jgi:hypothetical protein
MPALSGLVVPMPQNSKKKDGQGFSKPWVFLKQNVCK